MIQHTREVTLIEISSLSQLDLDYSSNESCACTIQARATLVNFMAFIYCGSSKLSRN